MNREHGPHAEKIATITRRIGELTPQRLEAVAKAYAANIRAFDSLLEHLMKMAEREGRASAAKGIVSLVAARCLNAMAGGDISRLGDPHDAAQLRPVAHSAARVVVLLPLALLLSDYISEEDFDLAEMYFTSATGTKPWTKRPDLMAPWRGRPVHDPEQHSRQ